MQLTEKDTQAVGVGMFAAIVAVIAAPDAPVLGITVLTAAGVVSACGLRRLIGRALDRPSN